MSSEAIHLFYDPRFSEYAKPSFMFTKFYCSRAVNNTK